MVTTSKSRWRAMVPKSPKGFGHTLIPQELQIYLRHVRETGRDGTMRDSGKLSKEIYGSTLFHQGPVRLGSWSVFATREARKSGWLEFLFLLKLVRLTVSLGSADYFSDHDHSSTNHQGRTKRMQATARRLSVVSATSCARRRLIRDVRPTNSVTRQSSDAVCPNPSPPDDRLRSRDCPLVTRGGAARARCW